MAVKKDVLETSKPGVPAHQSDRSIAYRPHTGWSTRTEQGMKEHEFTLILTSDPDEEEADRVYGIIDDGTLSTIAGVPQIRFHREASSLEEAIRSAMADVTTAGLDTARVEVEAEALAQPV